MIDNIISFKIWNLSWVFIENKDFCLKCFLYFFAMNDTSLRLLLKLEENLLVFKGNIYYDEIGGLIPWELYLRTSSQVSFSSFKMPFYRHPYCSDHLDNFFLDTEDVFMREKLKGRKDLKTFSIEDDSEICWISWIVKKTFFDYSATALSHNPLAFLYDNENVLFVCSWYREWVNSEELSKRISIMEGVERFATFSFCSRSLIPKSYLKENYFNGNEYLWFKSFKKVFNTPFSEVEDKYMVSVFDVTMNKTFLIDSDYATINPKTKDIIFNSTWCSAHLDLNLSVINWLKEIIERDSLMKMWIYRVTPWKYNIEILPQHIIDMLGRFPDIFDLSLYKVKTVYWYTTLAYGAVKNPWTEPYKFIYWSSHSFLEIDSIKGAILEMYTTFNNLPNYQFKNISKEQVLTVMDHYYYYQNNENYEKLSFIFEWNGVVSDINNDYDIDFKTIISNLPFRIFAFNLTPAFLFDKWIYVTKIISDRLQPMDFWFFNLRLSPFIDMSKVSKKSILEPHPFF